MSHFFLGKKPIIIFLSKQEAFSKVALGLNLGIWLSKEKESIAINNDFACSTASLQLPWFY